MGLGGKSAAYSVRPYGAREWELGEIFPLNLYHFATKSWL